MVLNSLILIQETNGVGEWYLVIVFQEILFSSKSMNESCWYVNEWSFQLIKNLTGIASHVKWKFNYSKERRKNESHSDQSILNKEFKFQVGVVGKNNEKYDK